MGRRFTNEYVITEYEPNRKVMYESTPTAAVQAEGGQIWQTVDGGTRVTFLFRPQLGDFWGLVPIPIIRRIYMRPLSNNMKRLKQVLESQR